MEQVPMYHTNPWDDGDSSIGTIRNVLALAEKFGYIRRNEVPTRDELLEDAYDKTKSLKLITVLKNIEETRKQIDKVNLEIQSRLLDKETRDITRVDILERRIEMINKLNAHLQEVISNKDQLVSRLQQPYTGDFLKIDAKYKSYLCEVMPDVVDILGSLTTHLEKIEWNAKEGVKKDEMESVLTEVSTTLAKLQQDYNEVTKMREAIKEKNHQRQEQNDT